VNNDIPKDCMGLSLEWSREFVMNEPTTFSKNIKELLISNFKGSVYIKEANGNYTMIINKGKLVSNEITD
jgi:hypothetical protein